MGGDVKTHLGSEAGELSPGRLTPRLGRLLHRLHTLPAPPTPQEVEEEVVEEDVLHIDASGVRSVGEGTCLHMFTEE